MRLAAKALFQKKKAGEKITALTAYDFPTAKILDGIVDIILVGDSLGMVMLGYESTVPVTMRDMLHHVKAVSRAVKTSLLVADMPFGSYDSPQAALRNAKRFLKEACADAVKLEGGKKIESQIRALVNAGIPVMGHLGMTPQTATLLGGYKVQGKNAKEAAELERDAVLLDRLGVFSLVLECIPAALAGKISRKLRAPVIGIGAGPRTDGQILVLHDMLGYESSVRPRFVRRYADLGAEIKKAALQYKKDVLAGDFPLTRESY